MLDSILEGLLDALIDSAKLVPFLFIIYILLEFFNRNAGSNIYKLIKKNEKLGPFFGGTIGIIPQCGLSAAAATLYSSKIVSLGTMLAVFLSASDDMLPILMTESVPVVKIVYILAIKLLIGVVSGYAVDLVMKYVIKRKTVEKAPVRMMSKKKVALANEPEICMQSCCQGNFFIAVIKHTLQVFFFIFVISFLLNLIISYIGEAALGNIFKNIPIVSELLAALIGLIPNCASSVVITQLYLSKVMPFGAMLSGLLVNAGVGLLVLFKSNKNKKETGIIIFTLYFLGVFWGLLFELTGFSI